jgi:YesN/AraC family two-component response regulator
MMPGLDGVELVRRVQLLRPNLPCLIVSGYADVEGIAPDLPRLTKPFKVEDLREALIASGFGAN